MGASGLQATKEYAKDNLHVNDGKCQAAYIVNVDKLVREWSQLENSAKTGNKKQGLGKKMEDLLTRAHTIITSECKSQEEQILLWKMFRKAWLQHTDLKTLKDNMGVFDLDTAVLQDDQRREQENKVTQERKKMEKVQTLHRTVSNERKKSIPKK